MSKSKYIPVVGDGVFYYGRYTTERGIVRKLITDTYTARQNGTLEKDARIIAVGVTLANGTDDEWLVEHIHQESFIEYLLRPTGMGRWKWSSVVPLIAISLALAIGAFVYPVEEFGWRVFIRSFIPALWVLILYMHWRNYTHRTN